MGQGARGWHPRGRPFRRRGTDRAQRYAMRRAGRACCAGRVRAREPGRGWSAHDRDGPRSAPGADHGRVDRHGQRRDRPRARDVGRPRERAAVPGPLPRPATRGGVGGDDGLAVRGRGVARDRCPGASGRAGGDQRAARQQEARQDRPRGRAALARAVDDRAAAGVVDPAGAPLGSARACAVCVTHSAIGVASGSSGSRRCSITTAARGADR